MSNLAGTIHKADAPYVSVISENQIEVRLQTPKDIVMTVDLGYNDPYNYLKTNINKWIELETTMTKFATDDLYDWWRVILTVDRKSVV